MNEEIVDVTPKTKGELFALLLATAPNAIMHAVHTSKDIEAKIRALVFLTESRRHLGITDMTPTAVGKAIKQHGALLDKAQEQISQDNFLSKEVLILVQTLAFLDKGAELFLSNARNALPSELKKLPPVVLSSIATLCCIVDCEEPIDLQTCSLQDIEEAVKETMLKKTNDFINKASEARPN